jgi:hypothetical protein
MPARLGNFAATTLRSFCRQTNGNCRKRPAVFCQAFAKRSSIAAFGLGVYHPAARWRTAMFISIRKYHNVKSVDEVRRRVEQEFVPTLKQNPGFLGYHLIDCGCPDSGNIVTSIRQHRPAPR